ncbi:class I SAM-dependent methyltransferase [Bryobacter aggregatus]|uniref:class I SAM-dependent methyltransferase n=1 Tax=Bryobacter aggregatus TaxID=360054 RepID=UPI00138E304B|nr:class I SAM-dependent methyltransferase [Bryobacter aggregatus]
MRTLFHATDRLYHTTNKSFLVVECQRCRLIRLYPKPKPEELSTYYPSNYWHSDEGSKINALEQFYRRLVSLDHTRFLERAIRDAGGNGLVMDVGCGGALLLRMLRENGHQVLGLDYSLDAASIAWKQNGVPAFCGTLSQAPLRDESVSVLSMFHVLEHLYEPAEYLRMAHRLLKPDGRLVIQVPNAASWQFLLFGENWNGIDVPRHLYNFRLSDINVLLDGAGFEPVRYKHFSLRDNPAGFSISLAPGLDPMARRIRKIVETPAERLFKNLVHLGLMVIALPFSAVEALCHVGSTVIVEARKKK